MGKKGHGRGCGCGVGCGCGCCGGGPIAICLLVLLNTAFLAGGVALVAFGILAKTDKSFTSLQGLVDAGLDDKTLSTAGFVVIGFGCLVAIVSAFGCIAVCCGKSKCLVFLYGFSLFLIFCCGIATAIVYGLFNGKIKDKLSGGLTKSLKNYKTGNEQATEWDYVQSWISCCGSNGPKDYTNITLGKDMHVPDTCCVLTNSDAEHPNPRNKTACQIDAYNFQHGNLTSSLVLETSGCYDSIQDYVTSKLGIIIGVGVAISTLQMFGICLVIGLCMDSGGYGRI